MYRRFCVRVRWNPWICASWVTHGEKSGWQVSSGGVWSERSLGCLALPALGMA